MIINTILIVTYFAILIERAVNKTLHHSFHHLFHSFLIFIMLYIIFVSFSKNDDDRDFENNVIDRQIDKVTTELNETTDIRRKGDFPVNNFSESKNLLSKTGIILALSIILGVLIIFYIVNRYTKSIKLYHLRYYTLSVLILSSIEILFNFLIKQHTFKSRKENIISTEFLDNIDKYSTFVP